MSLTSAKLKIHMFSVMTMYCRPSTVGAGAVAIMSQVLVL